MFALDLLAGFAGLLDDEVRRMALYDDFDFRLFVSGNDDEARDVCRDTVVLGRRKLNRLEALVYRALAMEWQRLLDTVLLRAFLDSLIDRTEDFFVACGRIRKIHRRHSRAIGAMCQGSTQLRDRSTLRGRFRCAPT